MPTFKFKLRSEVEVEAPNKAEAMKLARTEVYEAVGRIAHEARYVSRRPTNTTEFIDTIVKPLAKKLQKEFPGYKARVMGPFGLDVEVLIVLENGNEDQDRSLTFTPGRDFSLMLKDYSKNLQRFKEGTIGYMNGMNYASMPVPRIGRIPWLKERLISHQEAP